MQPEEAEPLDVDEALHDPELAAIAAAILDGTPIDWTAAAASAGSRHAATFGRLRVLADLAGLHRSLTPAGSDAPGSSSPLAEPIRQWGPLTIGEPIGSGSFGEVFRAWDTRLDREVALKLLRRLDTAESVSTVIEEGRLLARVRHPNVVTVYGAERIDGRIGIWTEFVHGQTVAAWVRERGRLEIQEAVSVALDVSRALAAVHTAGVVHGDVKAQNVLREPNGRIVLVDLGTGHELRSERVSAAAYELGGTPLYMAPELWAGSAPTPASDVYSVGVLLYYVLTGTYPLRGATADEVRVAHETGRRVALRDERDDLPAALAQVVDRALEPDPAKRFASADELANALARLQADLSPRPKRRALTLAVASIAVLLVGATVAYSVSDRFRRIVRFGAPATVQGPPAESRTELLHEGALIWGRPSRDGRHVPYSEAGSLWLFDRMAGRDLRVTTADGTQDTGAVFSLASPDGRLLAYEWHTGRGQFELRVINADGSEPRVLVPVGLESRYTPLEYSRDGSQILCFLNQRDGRRDLALVAADGTVRVIERFHENAPENASLSPDARFVVYARLQSSTGATADRQQRLFIADVAGNGPRDLLPGDTVQANDRTPVWTPDGDVVFVSNRGRGPHLWMVDVEDGTARGEPVIMARDVNAIDVLGLTDDGAFFYSAQKQEFEVYLIGLDPGAGKVVGQPARINPEEAGGHVGGSWSPNRESFMYVDRNANALKVRSLRTQTTRDVKPAMAYLGNAAPRWSPDSRFALVRGRSLRNEWGYFRVNLETQETALLVPFGANDRDFGGTVEWSRDGSAIRYWHSPRGIIYHEVASKTERVLVPPSEIGPLSPVRFATSPNDERLVFFAGFLKDIAVFKLGREGGAFQEVRRFPERASLQHWSVDGRELYIVRPPIPGQAFHLQAMSAIGGALRDLGALTNWTFANQQVAVRADGQEVAYTQGQNSSTLWVLEHFLPNPHRR